MYQSTAYSGLAAVGLFVSAFLVIGLLTPEFNFLNDYISQLGAIGQPFAIWWNILGFVCVGLLLAVFGWNLGQAAGDTTMGVCLVLTGLGFALGGVPTNFADENATLSKVHFAAICLGMAGWCFALARMSKVAGFLKLKQSSTNTLISLAMIPFVGSAIEIFSVPIAQRLLLCLIFACIIFVSIKLLCVDSGNLREESIDEAQSIGIK